MRKTLSRFTSSFAALFADNSQSADDGHHADSIRTAMLDVLSHMDRTGNRDAQKVWFDVARAHDVQMLWYLRCDVFRVVANQHGEQIAHRRLNAITAMFNGLVAPNQMPLRRAIAARALRL